MTTTTTTPFDHHRYHPSNELQPDLSLSYD
jgi:hypothetical protein